MADVRGSIPSVKDLFVLVRAKPGQVFYSHAGAGSSTYRKSTTG